MFDTLPASHTAGVPRSRSVLAALLLHVLLIVAAVGSTASPPANARPIARDTIQLQMTEPVEDSRPESAESPRSRAEAILPERPRVPDISINAPEFQQPPLGFTMAGPEAGRTSLNQGSPESRVGLDSLPSIFSTADVDELPVLMKELHPRYPDGLWRAGVSGLVQVQYVIGRRIDERSVRVLGRSHPAFLLSALQALRDARFRPARRGGQPEAVLVQQTIRFRYR